MQNLVKSYRNTLAPSLAQDTRKYRALGYFILHLQLTTYHLRLFCSHLHCYYHRLSCHSLVRSVILCNIGEPSLFVNEKYATSHLSASSLNQNSFFPLRITFFNLKFSMTDVSTVEFFAVIFRFSNVKYDNLYL